MNSQKIRELCARAMGWHAEELPGAFGDWWLDCANDRACHQTAYNPLKHADQASELLETVADGRDITTRSSGRRDIYTATIWNRIGSNQTMIATATSETNLREAMVLCALRASPNVPDDELENAINEGE